MNSLFLNLIAPWKVIIIFPFLVVYFSFLPAYCGEKEVFVREDFNSLDNWRPLYFPKITRHSRYTVVKEQDASFLKAESDSSASGIIYRKEFNVYDFPKIRWRWRIENVYKKGNAEEKSGDDYPVRLYIIFKYDPEKASLGKKIRYGIARRIYGEYPPDSSLNYIWASKGQAEKIFTNPYADEAKMIIVESGVEKSGIWVEEDADIVEDYIKAFGVSPPAIASIAIMNDSDNTGESSVSYVDYIEIHK
ncbi:MAG: DUF3047 domain-containing protein [Nitrospirota bacterium]|nr:DUF3047 domain-containing protein [Nitrospirota bacterium]